MPQPQNAAWAPGPPGWEPLTAVPAPVSRPSFNSYLRLLADRLANMIAKEEDRQAAIDWLVAVFETKALADPRMAVRTESPMVCATDLVADNGLFREHLSLLLAADEPMRVRTSDRARQALRDTDLETWLQKATELPALPPT